MVGQELPEPLVVHATDANGRDVKQQIINFRVVSGGGSVFAGTALTNEHGLARERWTLGTSTSLPQRVEARAVDPGTGEALVFARFDGTALPDVPARIVTTGGDDQVATAGATLPLPVSARVLDRFDNAIPGVEVTFSTAPSSGTVSPSSATTTATGEVEARWVLGTSTGSQALYAGVAGVAPATFHATSTQPPPRDLLYATNPVVHEIGTPVAPNVPSNSGGAVSSYSVAPPLPSGLKLDQSTGWITGTPLEVAEERTYVVTAANSGGSTTAALVLTVNDAPPSDLAYVTNPASYEVAQPIAPNRPSTRGGAVVAFSVAPPLPQGLSLDPATGIISGAPAQVSPPTTYLVMATNSGGLTSVALELEIRPPPPPVIVAAPESRTLSPGQAFTATVNATGTTPLSFQWYRDGVAIPGATSSTYSIPTTTSDDGGRSLTVTVTDAYGSRTTSPAALITLQGFTRQGQTTPRAYGTAAILKDGRVLLAGGRTTGGAALISAQLFDPVSQAWSTTGNLVGAGGAAAPLNDGRVLFASSTSAEIYDPATGEFSATGGMSRPINPQLTAVLADGRVLVAGEDAETFSTLVTPAEIYDPHTGKFASATAIATDRWSSTLVRLGDGRILVSGGGTGATTALDSAFIYDPGTGIATPTGAMKIARWGHRAALLGDGRVLIIGGMYADADYVAVQDPEIYDPATGTWTLIARPAWSTRHTALAALADGRALALGGTALSDSGPPVAATIFDPTTNAWSETGAMWESRDAPTVVALSDGTVLVVGGYASGTTTVLGSVERFDPTVNP